MKNKNFNSISEELKRIAEVAGFLWQRGWAEANGGNISVNLTHLTDSSVQEFHQSKKTTILEEPLTGLPGNLFYVTGAGKRMRDVAKSPLDFGAIIKINDDGISYEIVSEKFIKPTSELPSHLSIHNFLKAQGKHKSVVLHTHPTELIALTHCKPFGNAEKLSRMLWSMIPETIVLVPRGLGIVPYILTGTTQLANETIRHLENHDVVMWEKHGILAVGEDIGYCFDLIDTLSKSANIYLAAKTAGFEPQGLNNEQLKGLVEKFNLPPNKFLNLL
ncbi:MAG: rhamnulose-1-phosphate aldolase [Bacteroidales bacterium]|nr:rhamnulose-1-phosphate aldolase [Bacteroidales bacterium]